MNPIQSIKHSRHSRGFSSKACRLLGVVLGSFGAMLATIGRVLIVLGLLAQTLRARLGPQ